MKESFFKYLGVFFIGREKVLNSFKSRLFPIRNLDKLPTLEPTLELATKPTEHKKSKLRLQQEFMNEIIADKKDIHDEILGLRIHHQSSIRIHRL